ncbi:hypothetical protein MIZ03_1828 [Rhodoferax lithotrophicus]|uniref:Uncharacterized protein n=1 Tax=Rhodoferax lithotrophicus TaxID=2798804 RepID=A0ABN6D7X5_9BURK|nr:hypothetical protein [Rhodoferax sp. MIZ03]BCO26941.1 hypothetical protein MIZ03_1828 [Rhodoferax sp. MIZ03]
MACCTSNSWSSLALMTNAPLDTSGGHITPFQKLWVITEATGEDGVTRASTCFMLPKEY